MPSQYSAFYPQIASISIAATSVPSVGISPSTVAGGPQGLRVSNTSTNDVYIWLFNTSTGVVTLSSLFSTATAYQAMRIKQGTDVLLSCPPITYISAVTTAATLAGTLVVTAGYGIS